MIKKNSEFTINKDKPAPNDERYAKVYSFAKGNEFEDEDGYPILDVDGVTEEEIFTMEKAYAVKLEMGNRTKYYVKRGKYGKLFNPIGLYSEGTVTKQLRHAGKPEWVFCECTEKIFRYYIEFLKTKNKAWLNNAEREI